MRSSRSLWVGRLVEPPIESPRPHQGRVEHLGPVRGGDQQQVVVLGPSILNCQFVGR